MTPSVVVMGVSGSGKTTVGRALADRLRMPFVDADDHHPPANVEKMRSGVPLDDGDRAPWLASLHAVLSDAEDDGRPVVLACSALKAAYRDRLVAGLGSVAVVHLQVSREVAADRLRRRRGHFMPVDLLASQLDDLEEPQAGEAIVVDADQPLDAVVDRALEALPEA